MDKTSIWRRMGGWFNRLQIPAGLDDRSQIGSDDRVVESAGDDNLRPSPGGAPPLEEKRERQLTAMEESLNRLVGGLESLSSNVARQHQQNSRLIEQFTETGQLLQSFPPTAQAQKQAVDRQTQSVEFQTQTLEAQNRILESQRQAQQAQAQAAEAQSQTINQLLEQIKSQADNNQQLADIVRNLPGLTREQLTRLTDISQQLQTAGRTETQMAETLSQLNTALQNMAVSSKSQTAALVSIQQSLENSEQRLQEAMAEESGRITRTIWIALAVFLGVIGALSIILFLVNNWNKMA